MNVGEKSGPVKCTVLQVVFVCLPLLPFDFLLFFSSLKCARSMLGKGLSLL